MLSYPESTRIYKNHSIRAIGITILSESSFLCIDIVSVSTHKSISLFQLYEKNAFEPKDRNGNSDCKNTTIYPIRYSYVVTRNTNCPNFDGK